MARLHFQTGLPITPGSRRAPGLRLTTSSRFSVCFRCSPSGRLERFSERASGFSNRPPNRWWKMQMPGADAQQEVNDYFESSSSYWKGIYSDDELLPTIYQDRHNTALRWVTKLALRPDARILEAGC